MLSQLTRNPIVGASSTLLIASMHILSSDLGNDRRDSRKREGQDQTAYVAPSVFL